MVTDRFQAGDVADGPSDQQRRGDGAGRPQPPRVQPVAKAAACGAYDRKPR